jgi:hypothetical protein
MRAQAQAQAQVLILIRTLALELVCVPRALQRVQPRAQSRAPAWARAPVARAPVARVLQWRQRQGQEPWQGQWQWWGVRQRWQRMQALPRAR